MRHRFTTLLVVVGLIVAVGCTGQDSTEPEDPAQAAYSQFRDGYLNATDRAAQVALVEEFITAWPNHKYAGYFAADVVSYWADDQGDPDRAYEILAGVLDRAEDAEVRFGLGTTLAPVAAELGRDLDLTALITDLEAEGELDFDQAEQIMVAAADLGDWELLNRYADAALARATPEAFQAEYPDREFEDDALQRYAGARRVTALAYAGWATYNLGRAEDALAAFEEADGIAERNYVGLTGTPLARYWAEALVGEGDADRAISVLAREAVFGDREAAEPALRRAWAEANGSEEGFEDFVETTRLELAPTIDDFTLTDYEGNKVALNDIRRDTVTLLAFWFPT